MAVDILSYFSTRNFVAKILLSLLVLSVTALASEGDQLPIIQPPAVPYDGFGKQKQIGVHKFVSNFIHLNLVGIVPRTNDLFHCRHCATSFTMGHTFTLCFIGDSMSHQMLHCWLLRGMVSWSDLSR